MSFEGPRTPPPPVEKSSASVELEERSYVLESNERVPESVSEVMRRNNVFIVHTIEERKGLRHNENSNVSANASFEDDLDILLSLQPSISASSVQPGEDEHGRVSGLWSHSGGVIVTGGRISAAHEQDIGTLSKGIRSRHAFSEGGKTAAEIDRVVQGERRSLPGELGGYNELVVDNAEVAGYFKPAAQDESGTFWAGDLETRDSLLRMHELYGRDPYSPEYRDESARFHAYVNNYRDRFNAARERGLPFYAMTPDRRLFEVVNINDNGSLAVGAELTPATASGRTAGLTPETRKEIGKKLLERNVFRDQKTQQEAEAIIQSL